MCSYTFVLRSISVTMLAVVNLVTKFIILAGMLSHCAQPQDLLEGKPYTY